MKTLIITKPTNLEQHGGVVRSQIKRQKVDAHHLADLETAHSEHYQCLEMIRTQLTARGIKFHEINRGNRQVRGHDYDLIISVGGDGTLLSASHRIVDDTPVIGFRSSNASVGYLCAGGIYDVETIISRHIKGEQTYAACARLMAIIHYTEQDQERHTVPVLNDFLFANQNPSATTRYRVIVNKGTECHKSSGMWIATATGSTAGIRAAGGESMARLDTRFQYRVRELYRPEPAVDVFNFCSGFFDPDHDLFCIENLNEGAVLALDGQRGVISLKFGDRVRFVRAPAIKIALPDLYKPADS